MISPPSECPTSAIRVTGDRPAVDQPLEQGGERDAVLAQRQPGVGAQQDRGPAALGEHLGVRRAGALAVPAASRTRSRQAVQEDARAAGRLRERRGERVRLEVDVGAVQADRHRDRQLRPLAQQPVADQPVDRRAHEPAARRRPRAAARRRSAATWSSPVAAAAQPARRARRRPRRRCRGAATAGPGVDARGPGRGPRGGCRGRCSTTSSSATSASRDSASSTVGPGARPWVMRGERSRSVNGCALEPTACRALGRSSAALGRRPRPRPRSASAARPRPRAHRWCRRAAGSSARPGCPRRR